MSKLRITQRVLYNQAKPVEFDYPMQLGKLRKQLSSIMLMRNGIGLAAPQVGISKQVFVMTKVDRHNIMEKNKVSIEGIFNPDIIEFSKETAPFVEGCLSFPGQSFEIVRPIEIRAKWYDENGVEYEEELDGMNARIFQHEFDHLYGVTFDKRV